MDKERVIVMKIENSKIAEITEEELFTLYLKRGMDDIYSFAHYVEMFKKAGTLVLPGKEEGGGQMKFFGNAATMPTQTNADRIRAMSDRELADFLSGKFSEVCCAEHTLSIIQLEALKHNLFGIFMKWLKQPAEDQ